MFLKKKMHSINYIYIVKSTSNNKRKNCDAVIDESEWRLYVCMSIFNVMIFECLTFITGMYNVSIAYKFNK